MVISTIKEYACAVLRHWLILFGGAICGLVGALKDMEILAWPIPSFLWWLAAGLALFLAQFKAFQEVRKQREALKALDWDITLKDFVDRITDGRDMTENGVFTEVGNSFGKLREDAGLGHITVWGRPDCMEGHEDHVPRGLIAADFWAHNQINLLEFWKNSRGETELVTAGMTQTPRKYADLYLNIGQIELRWPKPNKRWEFQSPIKRME